MPIRAIYTAYLLLKEGLHRLTGMSRDASLGTTLFTSGMVLSAGARLTAPLRRALRRPSLPSPATVAMSAAGVRHVARSIGGEPLRDTPYAAAIIASGMVLPAWRVALLPVRVVQALFAALARSWRYLTVGPRRRSGRPAARL
jgi:hypothetical protein